MLLTNIDYFIIVLSVLSGLIFIVFWVEKLHRFYFWFIIWFLFFILINLHIRLLASVWDKTSFLIVNHSFILSFISVFIPILWFVLLVTDYISFKVRNNLLISFIFWLIFPVFFISLFSYIYAHSYWEISFLKDFFVYFSTKSIIISHFRLNPIYAIYFLYFLILFRLFLWLFLSLIIYIINEIKYAIKKEKEDAEENS